MISGVPDTTGQTASSSPKGLRRFSRLTCFSTLFLIFAGGMVTSTGSGLAVPDWPLSYGTLFPPMVGGIFYEHGHRMVATTVGSLVLCLTIWLGIKEKRRWVRHLGIAALGAVVLQGILGGLTVLFFLPTAISASHAVLAQTFFIVTIVIAYSLSLERERRESLPKATSPWLLRMIFVSGVLIYVQLIFGALMRHTESGLAIPDFPRMGGYWIPPFNDAMLRHINDWRFEHDLPMVNMAQVMIHFVHRAGAFFILVTIGLLNIVTLREKISDKMIMSTVWMLNALVAAQIGLGIFTVLSEKSPHITSTHVMTGAATLGVVVLLFLRAAPLSWLKFKSAIF